MQAAGDQAGTTSLQHQLDHAGWWRVDRRDSGCSDTTKYPSGSVFYLYTPILTTCRTMREFGGLMTEVRIN